MLDVNGLSRISFLSMQSVLEAPLQYITLLEYVNMFPWQWDEKG